MEKKIAIIGFSYRLPNTTNNDFWQALLEGRDLITEVNADRWSKDIFQHPNKNNPGTSYTFSAGTIGDISSFDAEFFGISPREAAVMDPQQLLLLEMSWEALENAGIKPSSIRGSQCGVFIGISGTDHSYRIADDLAAIDASTATGNALSIAANRISFALDLSGPSFAVDTACSSSLIAFHQACQSIMSGECTQALTGGINLHIHPFGFIIFSKASMLSPRGRCNPFDERADGYVRSEGGGIFILKDYEQALADGDQILALVANTGINTDGHKSGLTIPNATAQANLLHKVYSQAGIDPTSIDYIEAHGTGTSVGDPLEAKALGNALGKLRPTDNPLLIGSVKSNLGHLEPASGVAGLVKALYCLQHRTIPATIGIQSLNPTIPFADLNLKVVTQNQALKEKGKLTIGINSFGFGGANAHVILESHEPSNCVLQKNNIEKSFPIILTGKNSAALKESARNFADFIETQPESALYNIAYSSVFHRDWHEHRAIFHGTSKETAIDALLSYANTDSKHPQVESSIAVPKPVGPAFIYSGNGSQWAGMGKHLLEEEPSFKRTIQEIDTLFSRYANFSLLDELSGKNGEDRYQYTEISQPALFAIQVGITELLRQKGLSPIAVTGHSVGEVAAAWASGALTLDDAVKVIYHRSQSQGTTKGKGAMTAVSLSLEAMEKLLEDLSLSTSLTIAGINSSNGLTIAGSILALKQLETALKANNTFYRRLDLDYAFHSPFMDDIEISVKQNLTDLNPNQTTIPFYSTVTGELIEGNTLDANYWWHNIRNPVKFEQAIKSILKQAINIFIEIGPHTVLRNYISTSAKDLEINSRILSTITRDNDSLQKINETFNQALIIGIPFDWSTIFVKPGQFIQLPNYAWQRERHWHPVTPESLGLIYRYKIHPLLGFPLKNHDLTWENQLDINLNPTLADHVVGGATVFPGAGFAELALAAAFARETTELVGIEELTIQAPLLLNNSHTKLIRLTIDAKDGTFTIKGRQYGSHESWTEHSVGRILNEPNKLLFKQIAPALPSRTPDFNATSHHELTQSNDLDYGKAFQCIDYGWIDKNSALAVFRIPENIEAELAHCHLHPSILDCTFQLIFQILTDHVDANAGITFIPTKIGHLTFNANAGKPSFAKAALLRQTPRALIAEFSIFDDSGLPIAIIKEVRFRSIRLSKGLTDNINYLHYNSIPVPHHVISNKTNTLIGISETQAVMAKLVRRAALHGTYNCYSEEVEPLLECLCNLFTEQALRGLSNNGETLSLQDIIAYEKANPDALAYFNYLLTTAKEDQTLIPSSIGWTISTNQDIQASVKDIWNSLLADYPDYFHIIHAVGRVGKHLLKLLKGQLTLSQILPQESPLSALSKQVLGAEGQQNIGQTLRNIITDSIKKLPEGQLLNLLEISNSKPFFAIDTCAALNATYCNYVFASTSTDTLEEISQLKEQFPNIATQLIQNNPEFTPPIARYQLAVITLNFDTLEESRLALNYVHDYLVPGGILIVIGQHPCRWIDFIFGGQNNHWTQKDDDEHYLSNHRTAAFWQHQLHHLNFTHSSIYSVSPETLSGPYLLLAQREEQVPTVTETLDVKPRSWIIVTDETGYSVNLSDALTKHLQINCDIVIQSQINNINQFQTLLVETTANYGDLDGIIYLAGFTTPALSTTAETILEQQVTRCHQAAIILQACEKTQTQTTCWLVTQNAVSYLLSKPTAVNTPASTQMISGDAALWGFGRTMLNETSRLSVRLVDFENPLVTETIVTALEKELNSQDNEQEIIISRNGARYAPRLHSETAHKTDETNAIENPTITLGFQFPGQLRHLRWEAHAPVMASEDEIEIDVHATGLNFRDIMYTLGLLSDEAVENGFSGPSLGLEFSGSIKSVGSNVNGFSVGDKVLGFAPSSFSNRIITQANTITLIPANISYEAAATIPSTFFTVYYSLHYLARLQPGEKVLIHGATGGVGLAAIQIAKWIGAEIYATVGSEEKRDFLRLLGIDHIYDSRSLGFADEIMEQTQGEGIDVVLNSLAGEAINRNFQVLKPFGRFLELGKRDFYENTKIGLRPFRNNISYFGIDADQLLKVQTKLTQRLYVKMMSLFSEGILHPLPYRAFEADEIVDAFRYMQQSRQIGKIVITYRNGINNIHYPKQERPKALTLSAHNTYMVTGGLSGLGLKTAEWLAHKGAKHLLLIGRSGASTEAAQLTIAKLEAQDVQVQVALCDITNKQAISTLFTKMSTTMPPLKGIVHSATVIEDGLIINTDAAQIKRVLAPKVLGAYHLHDLTIDIPLDFFILFSSATTFFGNPGQANYVAANTCLENLAEQRRANGLPATCVAWGAIDDVGFLARNKNIKTALLNRMGGSALNSAIALNILEQLLIKHQSNKGVMEFNWTALTRFLPTANSPKFQELTKNSVKDDDKNNSNDIEQLLLTLSDEELLTTFIEMLKIETGEILRMSPHKIDAHKSIYDMGLDSLMGVELMVALEARFGIRLPVMTLNETPTLAKLAERIILLLKTGEQDTFNESDIMAQTQQIFSKHDVENAEELINTTVQNLQAKNYNHSTDKIIH